MDGILQRLQLLQELLAWPGICVHDDNNSVDAWRPSVTAKELLAGFVLDEKLDAHGC
ncbi:MAG: hypothetical protein JNK48_19125 [Bryobacterales bacterium]|nr:hypothetical protein [Bryobacterales bacterium]